MERGEKRVQDEIQREPVLSVYYIVVLASLLKLIKQ